MKVTIGTPIDMDIKSVNVPEQPVQKTIGTAGYGYINSNISKSETLVQNPGVRFMGVWHPNRNITSESAGEAMMSMITVIDGETYFGRPATVEELASYEIMFHTELGDTILVVLGEKVSDDSYECVAYRFVNGSRRLLNLHDWAVGWGADYRFLVVFEKSSEPE